MIGAAAILGGELANYTFAINFFNIFFEGVKRSAMVKNYGHIMNG